MQTFNNIGNEITIGTNRLTKGAGGDLGEHITSSNITDTGTVVAINSATEITGSLRGQLSALSISGNTASVNLSTNNFFTLTLANGTGTNINPTNINPGQTVNILVTQGSLGTGTVTFPSLVKQPSGSLYTGSAAEKRLICFFRKIMNILFLPGLITQEDLLKKYNTSKIEILI